MRYIFALPLLFFLALSAWASPIKVSPKANDKQDPSFVLKYDNAARLLERVINTQKFRDAVLAHTYNGKPGFASTADTPSEVLSKLVAGSEILTPGIDHEWGWEVVFYYSGRSTVGYTYANTLQVHVNTRFFQSFTLAQVGRNQAHEYTHKLGYGHDKKATSRRPYSVPYAIGSIVERLISEDLGIENAAPKPIPRPSFWRRLFFWL